MKRFYETVEIVPCEGGFAIQLDARPVKTPGRYLLVAPNAATAEGSAAEWRGQDEKINPAAMPVTRFLNTAIDRVAQMREEVVRQIVGFGETDLVCYRAERPGDLVIRQAQAWDPVVAWLKQTHGVRLTLTEGIMPIDQDPDQIKALEQVVAVRSHAHLAALHTFVSLLGSVTLGLALADDRLDVEAAWEVAHVDEDYQVEQWGPDDDEAARLAIRKGELEEAAVFLNLLKSSDA